MYRGPGAAANGPLHHYVFELYSLDIKVDVKPRADAFEMCVNQGYKARSKPGTMPSHDLIAI